MADPDFGSSSVSADRDDALVLAGEIDIANASDCLSMALTMLADCADGLTVDLSDVTFMDSTGIGMLLDIRTAASDAGKRVRLRGTPPPVQRLLVITGLADLFEGQARNGSNDAGPARER